MSDTHRSPARRFALRLADLIFCPLVALAARIVYLTRKYTLRDLPRSAKTIQKAGIYPLINHYYEPLIEVEQIRDRLDDVRPLSGLTFEAPASFDLLSGIPECRELVDHIGDDMVLPDFELQNGSFQGGDAEVLFGMVRHHRPARVVEVGCGNSTRVIQAAMKVNARDGHPATEHICIEPYEQPWLENFGVTLIRQPVEDCDLSLFGKLDAGDILFIDSSHMIRPFGDVVFLIQTVLGRLKPGVIVHVHDIFSPRNYPARLIIDHRVFWNEQYLLEAYLSDNPCFEILIPLNHLWHEDRGRLELSCPGLVNAPVPPASFWIRKIAEGKGLGN